MPMLPDDSGQTMALLMQITQMNNQRKSEQIRNLLETADKGQTVGELGVDPSAFKRMFGNIPYDPNKVLKPATSQDVIDKKLKGLIMSMDPATALNLAASHAQNQAGIPGFTTTQGLIDQMATGGIRDTTAKNVAVATQPVVQKTEIQKANTAATEAETKGVQAGTALVTTRDIADRIDKGIASMRMAPAEAQKGLNETLAFGKSGSALATDEYTNQLRISTLKEALAAQVDPKHPLHKFLAQNGLDLHTAMAGMGMGMGNLLENYAHGLMQLQIGNKEAQNIMLRMSTDAAKEMSEKVFMGKLTPQQVLTLMEVQQGQRALPKGYEGAMALMNQATSANYQAAVTKALVDGDPIALNAKQTIDNFGKMGKDVRQLEAVNEIGRLSTARIMTKLQTGIERPENNPELAARWDEVYQKNLKTIIGAKIEDPALWFKSYNVTGGPGAQRPGAGQAPVGITTTGTPAPTSSPLLAPLGGNPGQAGPVQPVQPVPGAVSSPVPGTTGQLTPEQVQAVQQWMKAYGAQQAGAQAPSNPAPPAPVP